jgi:hypothetical protein
MTSQILNQESGVVYEKISFLFTDGKPAGLCLFRLQTGQRSYQCRQ